MKTSCIQHPIKEPLIIVRRWQRFFCQGNNCAAALLSFYEYWHNIKLAMQQKNQLANDIAEKHGDGRVQDETLLQHHTCDELMEGIQEIYGRSAISEANKLLESLGAITIHKNPNPKYAFDKTRFYLFHPDVCNEWIKTEGGGASPPPNRKNDRLSEDADRSFNFTRSDADTPPSIVDALCMNKPKKEGFENRSENQEKSRQTLDRPILADRGAENGDRSSDFKQSNAETLLSLEKGESTSQPQSHYFEKKKKNQGDAALCADRLVSTDRGAENKQPSAENERPITEITFREKKQIRIRDWVSEQTADVNDDQAPYPHVEAQTPQRISPAPFSDNTFSLNEFAQWLQQQGLPIPARCEHVQDQQTLMAIRDCCQGDFQFLARSLEKAKQFAKHDFGVNYLLAVLEKQRAKEKKSHPTQANNFSCSNKKTPELPMLTEEEKIIEELKKKLRACIEDRNASLSAISQYEEVSPAFAKAHYDRIDRCQDEIRKLEHALRQLHPAFSARESEKRRVA